MQPIMVSQNQNRDGENVPVSSGVQLHLTVTSEAEPKIEKDASPTSDYQVSVGLDLSVLDNLSPDALAEAMEPPIQSSDCDECCEKGSGVLVCAALSDENEISGKSSTSTEQIIIDKDVQLNQMKIQLDEAVDRASKAHEKLKRVGQCIRVLTNQLLRQEAEMISCCAEEKNTKEIMSITNPANEYFESAIEGNVDVFVDATKGSNELSNNMEAKYNWNAGDKINGLSIASADSGDFDYYSHHHDKNGLHTFNYPQVPSCENDDCGYLSHCDGNRIRTNTLSSIASNASRISYNSCGATHCSVSNVLEEHEQFMKAWKKIQGIQFDTDEKENLNPNIATEHDDGDFVVLDLISLQNATARIREHIDLAFQDSYETYQDSCHWKESCRIWQQRALLAENELKKYANVAKKNKVLRNQRRMLIDAYRTIASQKHEILVHQVEDFVVHALSVHEQHLKTKATTDRGINTNLSYRCDSFSEVGLLSTVNTESDNEDKDRKAGNYVVDTSKRHPSANNEDNNSNLSVIDRDGNSIFDQQSESKKGPTELDEDHGPVESTTETNAESNSAIQNKATTRNNFVGSFGGNGLSSIGFGSCYSPPAWSGMATQGKTKQVMENLSRPMMSATGKSQSVIANVTTDSMQSEPQCSTEHEATADPNSKFSNTCTKTNLQGSGCEPVLRIAIGNNQSNTDNSVKTNQQVKQTPAANCDVKPTNDKNGLGARMMNFFNPPLVSIVNEEEKQGTQTQVSHAQKSIEKHTISSKERVPSSSSTTLRPLISHLDLTNEISQEEINAKATQGTVKTNMNTSHEKLSSYENREGMKSTELKGCKTSNSANATATISTSLGESLHQNKMWNGVFMSRKAETVSIEDSPIPSLKNDTFGVCGNGSVANVSPTTIATDFEISDDQILRSLSIPIDYH